MSAKEAQMFLESLVGDTSLRAQLLATGIASADIIVDFALNIGYVISEKDLKEALATFPDSAIIEQLRERLKLSKVAHPT